MSDIEKIKDRVKKLMAYAKDGAASDGEIENAMNHAAKLIDAHNLDADALAAEQAAAGNVEQASPELGRSFATTQASRFHQWESWLCDAVLRLYGTVKCYCDNDTKAVHRIDGVVQTDGNGNRKLVQRIAWYGLADDARDAAELFTEWNRSIATLAVLQWGNPYRGDGAAFCEGFCRAVYRKVCEATEHRNKTIAPNVSPKLLGMAGVTPPPDVETKALTIGQKNKMIQDAGKHYLKETHGIKLQSAGKLSGSRTGSSSAREDGERQGKAAQFTKRTSSTRLLGNG